MRKTKEAEKPEVKQPEVKAAAAETAAKAAKPAKAARPAKKAVEKTEQVVIQFEGREWDSAALTAKAKEAYEAEGHRASGIKTFVLYVKPEEGKAYYVVNEKTTGSIDL